MVTPRRLWLLLFCSSSIFRVSATSHLLAKDAFQLEGHLPCVPRDLLAKSHPSHQGTRSFREAGPTQTAWTLLDPWRQTGDAVRQEKPRPSKTILLARGSSPCDLWVSYPAVPVWEKHRGLTTPAVKLWEPFQWTLPKVHSCLVPNGHRRGSEGTSPENLGCRWREKTAGGEDGSNNLHVQIRVMTEGK